MKAEWIICSDGYYPYCSNCGEEPKSGTYEMICPNCGADMSDSVNEHLELLKEWGMTDAIRRISETSSRN